MLQTLTLREFADAVFWYAYKHSNTTAKDFTEVGLARVYEHIRESDPYYVFEPAYFCQTWREQAIEDALEETGIPLFGLLKDNYPTVLEIPQTGRVVYHLNISLIPNTGANHAFI